ncbi:hypothetical protein [Caballeronia sp. GAFFF3]|uniref:hypothetical protein n=1 Tax=Caballeronia sp. GAFFF3 TaxID=2921759 RepID=UPI0020284CCE|nr:hypothetical protein [Caballeronia sp. GAFFF3]
MSKENMLRGTMLTVTWRYAAGIDVSEDAVVPSNWTPTRAISSAGWKAMADSAMPASAAVSPRHREQAVEGECGGVRRASGVGGAAVGCGGRRRFRRSRAYRRGVARGVRAAAGKRRLACVRCAMGLPSSATLTTQVPLARLIDTHEQLAAPIGGDPRGLLEPAVLAEAERAAGIERGALAVDWRRRRAGRDSGDGAATRRGASRFPRLHGPCMAHRAQCGGRLAVGSGLHGWLVGSRGVENEVRYPAPEHRSISDALHELAGEHAPLDCIYVGGQFELMAHAGLPLPVLGKTFGCAALPFEAAPYCNGVAEIQTVHKHSPRFAVAVGLALREVMQ